VSAVRGKPVHEGRARSGRPSTLLLQRLRVTPNTTLGLGLPRLSLPRRRHRPRRALVSAFPFALCRYCGAFGRAWRPRRSVECIRLGAALHAALFYKDAARPHRHRVGTRWAVDETYIRLAGRWVYAYRAIDEHGQVIDVYLSETHDTAAATAFFERAIARTDVRPHRVTTDKAAAYPPALGAVVPEVEHITGKAEQQGIERDHQHLKGGRGVCVASSNSDVPNRLRWPWLHAQPARWLLSAGRADRRPTSPAHSPSRPRLG